MEHSEITSLGNWDSCYADNQDDQSSGDKSRQTQDIVISIGLRSTTRLGKNNKDQTVPTKIIVSNLNVSNIYYHFLVNIIFLAIRL